MKKCVAAGILCLALMGAGCQSSTPPSPRYDGNPGSGFRNPSSGNNSKTVNRDDAIEEHWDEIKDYLSGTGELEACSSDSGNCYDLDADISGGRVDQLSFPDGGNLDFSADIDEDGRASDSDNDGNNWDFKLDMDSSIVDDAIDEWAGDNEYAVE